MRQRVLTAHRTSWLRRRSRMSLEFDCDGVAIGFTFCFCGTQDSTASASIVITTTFYGLRCERIVVMYCGRVLETNAGGTVLRPRHPLCRGLIASLPHLGMKPMAGFSPAFTDQPSGCVFHPRCPYAEARCRHTEPKSIPCGEGSVCCHRYD